LIPAMKFSVIASMYIFWSRSLSAQRMSNYRPGPVQRRPRLPSSFVRHECRTPNGRFRDGPRVPAVPPYENWLPI
jgi:hypothetical protein